MSTHQRRSYPADPDERDYWLRAQGLPTLVPVRRWASDLPRRTAPLLVWLCALAAALVGTLYLFLVLAVDEDAPDWTADLVALAALAGLVVLPLLLAWATHRVLRRARHPALSAWLIMIVATVLSSLTLQYLDEGVSTVEELVSGAGTLLAVMFAVWVGLGSLLGWTLKSAFANLSALRHMAVIALPVILLLVIFAFFSAETWQATDSLSWPRLFAFGLVIAVIGAMVTLPASWRAVADARREATESGETAPALLRLRWWQQLNVVLVALISQLLISAIFAVLLGGILVLLGKIAITPAVMKTWLSHPAQPWVITDATLPVTVNLLKAATFLAMLAALSFLISTVSDRQYREHFFDPIVDRIVDALAARPASTAPDVPADPPAPAAPAPDTPAADVPASDAPAADVPAPAVPAPQVPDPNPGTEPPGSEPQAAGPPAAGNRPG